MASEGRKYGVWLLVVVVGGAGDGVDYGGPVFIDQQLLQLLLLLRPVAAEYAVHSSMIVVVLVHLAHVEVAPLPFAVDGFHPEAHEPGSVSDPADPRESRPDEGAGIIQQPKRRAIILSKHP